MIFDIKKSQPKVWELLHKTLQNEKVGSAYLFAGPSGVGKEAMAIEFGAEINKNYFKEETNLAQENYIRFKSLQHEMLKMVFPLPTGSSKKDSINPLDSLNEADIKIINELIEEKAGNAFHKVKVPGATKILINSVRELRKTLYLKSNDVGRKIVLIFEAHLLNTGQAESANALLKILEEPPQNTTIILVTDNKNQLLPTILSRCQHIDFPPLSNEVITQYLEENGIDAETSKIISGIAHGNMHKALELSKEPIDKLIDRIMELAECILDEDSTEWRKFINDNSQLTRKNPEQFQFNIYLLQIWFNSIYRLKVGTADTLHNSTLKDKMETFLNEYPNANLQKINILLEETLEAVGRNLYMSLTLTNLLINIHKNLK